jgi:hypothetical protein
MRFADMSLDVICKWRPSLHIYIVKKWREDGGRKRWKAREENRREAGRGGKHGKKNGGNTEARSGGKLSAG